MKDRMMFCSVMLEEMSDVRQNGVLFCDVGGDV